jgi:hypothetical protein
MVLEILKQKQVNLPLVGGVSLAAVIVTGLALYFLTRRKRTIGIRI